MRTAHKIADGSGKSWQFVDTRNVLTVTGILSAAVLLTWPFANMAFGDDVAYCHVAEVLYRTGHLTFNGWEAAMMAQQAYWGALFIKVFGSSFLSLRFSTFPLALGTAALCYSLSRKVGLDSSNALVTTLLLSLNPIFVPLTTSFMTDVPGLFFLFASLYALVLAAETAETWKGYLWLALSIAAGLLGGSDRQFVWFAPMALLPYLAWVRRRNTRFCVACAAGWLLSLVCVSAITSWFNRQFYVVPMPSLLDGLKAALKRPGYEVEISARLILQLLLMCLPVALPLAIRSAMTAWNNGRARRIVVGALLLGAGAAILIHPSLASIPWLGNNGRRIRLGGDVLVGSPIIGEKDMAGISPTKMQAVA